MAPAGTSQHTVVFYFANPCQPTSITASLAAPAVSFRRSAAACGDTHGARQEGWSLTIAHVLATLAGKAATQAPCATRQSAQHPETRASLPCLQPQAIMCVLQRHTWAEASALPTRPAALCWAASAVSWAACARPAASPSTRSARLGEWGREEPVGGRTKKEAGGVSASAAAHLPASTGTHACAHPCRRGQRPPPPGPRPLPRPAPAARCRRQCRTAQRRCLLPSWQKHPRCPRPGRRGGRRGPPRSAGLKMNRVRRLNRHECNSNSVASQGRRSRCRHPQRLACTLSGLGSGAACSAAPATRSPAGGWRKARGRSYTLHGLLRGAAHPRTR